MGSNRRNCRTPCKVWQVSSRQELIWVGPVVPPADEHRYTAVSPAGNRWQFSLLKSLRQLNECASCIGYRPERTFPFGRLFVPSSQFTECGIPIVHIGTINLRGIREKIIAYKALSRINAKSDGKRVVVLYNLDNANYSIATRISDASALLIPIIADGSPRDFQRLRELRRRRCRAVFLSWGDFQAHGTRDDLHLDGGVDKLLPPPAQGCCRPIVGYHGALGRHGGLSNLLKAWRLIDRRDARLLVTGQGDDREVFSAAKLDRRIRYFGCLPKTDLEAIQREVSVFVNPRPRYLAENRHNFPSKLVEYIGSGRYVVSTRSPGIAPDFEPHCIWSKDDTPSAIAEAINCALGKSDTGRFPEEGGQWVRRTRLWDVQAARFHVWLSRCAL